MNEVLTIDPQEVACKSWHVMGSRKIDFLIRLFNTVVDKQLIIVTDDSGWFSRFECKCHNHIIKFSRSFDAEVPCIYVKRAKSVEHARSLHNWVTSNCTLYTICDYDTYAQLREKNEFVTNTLHVKDSELIGITRYTKEVHNDRIAFAT